MTQADILFDELYNVLMDKCVPNMFVKRACGLIYSYVKEEIKIYYHKHNIRENYKTKLDKTKLKDCRKRVCKIINLFEETDVKIENFMKQFPTWKKCRAKNIKLLNEIAGDLHDEKKVMNAIKTITSVVGLAGGAAVLSSIFFPPAAVVTLPVWLGGSTVAALLPSSVLSVIGTTTAATSRLALTGGAACVVDGASKILAPVTELKLLKKHMDDAKAIILEDKKYFEDLKELFTHTDSFSDALKEILAFQTFDYVFKDVFEFLDSVRLFENSNNELEYLFQKYIPCISTFLSFEYKIVLIGILFVSFLVYKKNCFLFNNIVGACQILTGYLSMLNALGGLSITSAGTSSTMAPKVMARNIQLGTFTAIGMALDVITLIQTCIDIKDGSQNEYGKKVKEISDELKNELNVLETLYKNHQHSMLRTMFLESQNLL